MQKEQDFDSPTVCTLFKRAFTAQRLYKDSRFMACLFADVNDMTTARNLARQAVEQRKLTRVCEKWAAIASSNVSVRKRLELRTKKRES